MPYERQLAEKHRQVDEALRRLGGLDGFELEPIEPAVAQWRYRNKLEYSFGERPGELTLGFHRARQLGGDRRRRRLPARLGGQQRGPQRRPRVGPRQGLAAYDSRSETGVLRNLVVREGRRTGQIQTRLVTSAGRDPAAAGRPAHGDRGARAAAPTAPPACSAPSTSTRSSRACASASRTPPSCRPTPRWPSASTRSPASSPGSPAASASSTSTAGSARSASRSPARAGEVWGLEGVPEAVADAEHNAAANGIANARFVAADARLGIAPLLDEAGRPDVVVVDPPRSGPVEEDRPPAARVRGAADRLRLLQPDHAGARTRPRSSRRAIACGA